MFYILQSSVQGLKGRNNIFGNVSAGHTKEKSFYKHNSFESRFWHTGC